jgi:NADPH:quinone reductase-like Zn-dependent oxidoreductase
MRRALAPSGSIVMVAPQPGQWIGPVARVLGAIVSSRLGRPKATTFLSAVSRDDLFVLKEMLEAGRITPVIERTFSFDEIPDAIRHLESGRVTGKVVITL